MKTLSAKGIIGGRIFITSVAVTLLAGLISAKAGLTFLSSTYTVGHAPNCATAADVNGDGSLDLISANYADNALTVLTNSGGGIFSSNATIKVGIGPASVIAADISGNGKVDLVCANYGAGGGKTVTILTNNGSGVFGSNATITVGIGPYCVIAADLKGAGKLDLVTANIGTNANGNTLTILTNNGLGVLWFQCFAYGGKLSGFRHGSGREW
ncbi:MAG: VCBS repeat-containing protein [Limisphaerales bacterium]